MRPLTTAALVLFLCASLPPQVAEPPATRRALLVGINDYLANDNVERPEFADLHGCRNDVELMRELLTGSYGFTDVRVLEDGQATRQGMLDAFAALLRDVRAGDSVVFHFSGHGSQAPDFDDETVDSLDETLMPHDARTAEVRDIIDDELGAWLSQLRKKGVADLIVVLDCCHSGSGTRGLGVQARGAPPDRRRELYEQRSRGLVGLSGGDWVVITGAAADQNALDGPIDGRNQGAVTWALVQSLRAEPQAPPVRLWTLVEQRMAELASRWPAGLEMPDPQIEVPSGRRDRPLLTALAPAQPAGAAVAVAAAAPAEVAVHFEFAGGAVERRDELLRGVRAIVPTLRAVGVDEFARLRLRIDDERCEVRTPDGGGVLLARALGADPAAEIAGIVRRAARACALLELANPSSSLRLTVRAVKREASREQPTTRGVTVRTRNRVRTYRSWQEGAPYDVDTCLQLRIEASAECYLTIVDVDAGGAINVLFPVPEAEPGFYPEGRIPGGTPIEIPDALSDDNRSGLIWTIGPPAGLDTIRVFASTDLATAKVIRAGIAASIAATTDSEPADVFAELRQGLAARGMKIVRDQPAAPVPDWTAASITIRIVD